MKLIIYFWLGLLLCGVGNLQAQNEVITPDSSNAKLLVDSSKTVVIPSSSIVIKKKRKPSPKKALILSLVIPGGGQIYNRRYWKAPLVWGATGGMIFLAIQNTRDYRFMRDQYNFRIDDDPTTIDFFAANGYTTWTASDIEELRNQYNKNKELSYIGFVAIHLLSAVEAYVDAHLMDFDISEDLSMRIKPSFEGTLYQNASVGVGLSFQFSQKPLSTPKDFFGK